MGEAGRWHCQSCLVAYLVRYLKSVCGCCRNVGAGTQLEMTGCIHGVSALLDVLRPGQAVLWVGWADCDKGMMAYLSSWCQARTVTVVVQVAVFAVVFSHRGRGCG